MSHSFASKHGWLGRRQVLPGAGDDDEGIVGPPLAVPEDDPPATTRPVAVTTTTTPRTRGTPTTTIPAVETTTTVPAAATTTSARTTVPAVATTTDPDDETTTTTTTRARPTTTAVVATTTTTPDRLVTTTTTRVAAVTTTGAASTSLSSTVTRSTSRGASASGAPDSDSSGQSSGSNTGTIIGIVVGILAVLLLIGGLLLFRRSRRNKRDAEGFGANKFMNDLEPEKHERSNDWGSDRMELSPVNQPSFAPFNYNPAPMPVSSLPMPAPALSLPNFGGSMYSPDQAQQFGLQQQMSQTFGEPGPGLSAAAAGTASPEPSPVGAGVGAAQMTDTQQPFQMTEGMTDGRGEIHTVVRTFQPNQDDELVLAVGDSIRLLVKYDDGWALGINMSTEAKGVFPVDCLGAASERLEGLQPAQETGGVPKSLIPGGMAFGEPVTDPTKLKRASSMMGYKFFSEAL